MSLSTSLSYLTITLQCILFLCSCAAWLRTFKAGACDQPTPTDTAVRAATLAEAASKNKQTGRQSVRRHPRQRLKHVHTVQGGDPAHRTLPVLSPSHFSQSARTMTQMQQKHDLPPPGQGHGPSQAWAPGSALLCMPQESLQPQADALTSAPQLWPPMRCTFDPRRLSDTLDGIGSARGRCRRRRRRRGLVALGHLGVEVRAQQCDARACACTAGEFGSYPSPPLAAGG